MAKVTVSPDSVGQEKPWRMDCEACPDAEPLRFYTRHWGVAAADESSDIPPTPAMEARS